MVRRAAALAALTTLATVAVLAGGCGGRSTPSAGSGTPSTTTAVASTAAPAAATTAVTTGVPPDRSASILPSVQMNDVTRGTTVDLASLIPAQRPLLLWFWAPH